MQLIRDFFISTTLLLLASSLFAQIALPTLHQPVTDLTSTLDTQQVQLLNDKLLQLSETKGAQLAVVIINTTESESIETYSLRLAEKWKLGRKGIDDGVLLLIAKEDRELRIEVGYGLEGVLSDVVCKRIIDEIIVPEFKQNNFYQGIQAGVDQIIKLIEGESLPEPKQGAKDQDSSFAFVLIFVLFALAGFLRRLLGRFLAAIIIGAIAGFLIWYATFILIASLAAGFFAFILTLSDLTAGKNFLNRSGGFGGSGGGFRGGGGGFGGGGASGRW